MLKFQKAKHPCHFDSARSPKMRPPPLMHAKMSKGQAHPCHFDFARSLKMRAPLMHAKISKGQATPVILTLVKVQ